MSLLENVLKVVKILDRPEVSKDDLRELLKRSNRITLTFKTVKGDKGSTLFVKFHAKGLGEGPTIGVIGRLGGVAARPTMLGLVSDADGAIVALTVASKIAEMYEYGDLLGGDVIITTHITTHAPIKPYKPVPMMDSPVDIFTLLKEEVDPKMEAIISIDATKANKIINHTGIAITHIVRDGWILKVSDDILDIYTRVTGEPPVIVPLTMQDIIPFSTRVYHINSIVQPWIYTAAPILGVATTTRMPVPGSATGVTNALVLDLASRFVLEVVKEYVAKRIRFHDEEEWNTIIKVHGEIKDVMKRGAPI